MKWHEGEGEFARRMKAHQLGCCMNGNLCTHPACPDHEVRDFWDRTDWPTLADSDPWWDGLQSQADYRRMHHYFDVRGGTVNG